MLINWGCKRNTHTNRKSVNNDIICVLLCILPAISVLKDFLSIKKLIRTQPYYKFLFSFLTLLKYQIFEEPYKRKADI